MSYIVISTDIYSTLVLRLLISSPHYTRTI